MDSINNAIANAKSALGYGSETAANETAGREPISGQQGAGTATQPYDRGNETSATQITQDQPATSSQTSHTHPSSTPTSHTTSTQPPVTSSSTTTTTHSDTGLDYSPDKLSETTLDYRPKEVSHGVNLTTTGVTPTLPTDLGTDNAPQATSVGSTSTSGPTSTTHHSHHSHHHERQAHHTSSNPSAMDNTSSTPSQPGMKTVGSENQPTASFAGASGDAATNQPLSTGAPAGQSRPSAGERSGDVRPTEANENRPNTNMGGFGTAEPSVNADPKSGQKPQNEHDGADRPLKEPNAEETQAIKDDKAAAESSQEGKSIGKNTSTSGMTDEQRQEAAQKGELPHDPNDHSGEPMHMHGGPEGQKDEQHADKSEEEKEKARQESIGQQGGQPHGSSKGSGEEVVKASGFAADGGDFDAANPGAGTEATRLMEERGMKRDGGPSTSGGEKVSDDQVSQSKDSKPSMMQKIKDTVNPGTGSGLD